MTTKEKILNTALRLFNKRGISSITVRDIAEEIGISHGNLCYHYPATNDIIYSLYTQLTNKIMSIWDNLEFSDNLFKNHRAVTKQIFILIYNYRFIFLHLVEISQRIPKIKKRHNELMEQHLKQIHYFFDLLRDREIFRNDIPQKQYEYLIMHRYIYWDFWISSNEIRYSGPAAQRVDYFVDGYQALLIPYLTEKGKQLANRIA